MTASRSLRNRGHGKFLRYFGAIVTSLAASGCGQTAYDYRSGAGIGASLYTSEMAEATEQLNLYMGFLCQQAHFASYSPDKARSCLNRIKESGNWALLVHTGFNDIDRRCDDYLAWMEQARLRKDFGVSQLNALGNLTNAILLATTPSSAKAIGIVGLAFGYSQKLFTDIHTLINLGIENSTIKSIVSERRLDFREKFKDTSFTYKPNAVHTLRSYLRICMPYTITMDVNTFARATANGTSKEALERDGAKRVQDSLAEVKPLDPNTGFGSGGRNGRGIKPGADFDKIFDNYTSYEPKDLKNLQEALCVRGNRPGAVDGPTGNALAIFEDTVFASVDFKDFEGPRKNGKFDDHEIQFLSNLQGCDRETYRNIFERINFGILSENRRKEELSGFIALLNRKRNLNLDLNLALNSPDLREQIRLARADFELSLVEAGPPDQITQKLVTRLR